RPKGTIKVMRKHFSSTLVVAAAAILFGPAASAQQSPAQGSTEAPTSKPAASATPKSPTAGQSTGAAKTGQAGASAKKPAAAPGTVTLLKTDKDKRSYAIGLNIAAKVANELKSGDVDMDSAILARGIRDSLTGGKHLMTDEEVKTALTALETELRE